MSADNTLLVIKNEPEKISPEVLRSFKKQFLRLRKTLPKIELKPSLGEPSKYKQRYCMTVIEEMAEGKDVETVAVEMGITKKTFYKWCRVHPEFGLARRIGVELSKRWWVEIGRLNLKSREFNHILWMMNMTNKFGYLSSRVKEHRKIEKTEKRILELNFDDSRVARIVNLAANNKTIVEAGKLIEDKSTVYTD